MAVVNENYLFVYGEWLDSALVKAALPGARLVTTGTVEDAAFAFLSCADDAGRVREGGCCLQSRAGETLCGVLWKLTAAELEYVDAAVGLRDGRYTRRYCAVRGADGRAYAAVLHTAKRPLAASRPPKASLRHILAGAKELGFSEAYIDHINRLASPAESVKAGATK